METAIKYDWIEPTSWALLAGVAWLLMQSYPKPAASVKPITLSAQTEVDPTRWKHNGSQPIAWRSGNRPPIIDDYTKASIFSVVN